MRWWHYDWRAAGRDSEGPQRYPRTSCLKITHLRFHCPKLGTRKERPLQWNVGKYLPIVSHHFRLSSWPGQRRPNLSEESPQRTLFSRRPGRAGSVWILPSLAQTTPWQIKKPPWRKPMLLGSSSGRFFLLKKVNTINLSSWKGFACQTRSRWQFVVRR